MRSTHWRHFEVYVLHSAVQRNGYQDRCAIKTISKILCSKQTSEIANIYQDAKYAMMWQPNTQSFYEWWNPTVFFSFLSRETLQFGRFSIAYEYSLSAVLCEILTLFSIEPSNTHTEWKRQREWERERQFRSQFTIECDESFFFTHHVQKLYCKRTLDSMEFRSHYARMHRRHTHIHKSNSIIMIMTWFRRCVSLSYLIFHAEANYRWKKLKPEIGAFIFFPFSFLSFNFWFFISLANVMQCSSRI